MQKIKSYSEFINKSTNLNADLLNDIEKEICNYINKYPNDYYKQYVGFYNNNEELRKAEYDLIHPHLNKDYCMNLKEGGGNAPLSEETKELISENLKGKPAIFKCKVNAVKVKKEATLNDELAKQNGFNNVEELKLAIK